MRLRKKQIPEVSYAFPRGTEQASRPADVQKVGIYAASFDPVHAGHIVFALKAQKLAGLDSIYFVPERRPHHNPDAEHIVHRAVMLKRALKPHRQFAVLDMPDACLTSGSLARLRQSLPGNAEVSLLTTASDFLWYQGELPHIYEAAPLVVAVTSHAQLAEVLARVHETGRHFHNISFVDVGKDHISSAAIRSGLRKNQRVRGLLPSVMRYARQQWLYISPNRG